MKVIFMGTPEFALPALNAIIKSTHSVSAVFTQCPKPQGRGMKEALSPVHQVALQNSIPVYSPKTLRSNDSVELINNIEADIIVVVAYGFIIPKAILEAKKYGCLNIHPSALPRFRGAAPLQRTIIAGDKFTEICIMQMDEGLDTGDVILRKRIDLDDRITLNKLHDVCSNIGAELLIKTLDDINILPKIPQVKEGVVYAHKLTKEEGLMDWSESAFSIDCKVRGMSPWPGVYFEYNGLYIKILESEYRNGAHDHIPGTILGNSLDIACGDGILSIKKLQKPGKNALSAEEFLRGYKK